MKIAILGILGKKLNRLDIIGGVGIFNETLINGLVKKGHQVDIYNIKEKTDRKIENFLDKDYFKTVHLSEFTRQSIIFRTMQFADFIQEQQNYNLVHVSTFEWSFFLPFIPFLKIPHVITVHNKLLSNKILKILADKYPQANLVFVSRNNRLLFPKFKHNQVVYNGINLGEYSEKNENYIAWLSRIHPTKGLEDAIKVANTLSKKLKFGGPGEKTEYFLNIIKPQLKKGQIDFLGSLDFEQKNRLFGGAKVVLFPIRWEEPFGLVIIEAMACGTPVVAYNRGAVPEIIKDGITGFIVPPDDLDAMAKAVQKIYAMPDDQYQTMRKNCRAHVEENFTVEKMVDNYEKIYQKIAK